MTYNAQFNVPAAWSDSNDPSSPVGAKYDVMVGLHVGYYAEGNWGADWSGFNPSTDLPSNPQKGKWCIRRNLDDTYARIYSYDGSNWHFISISDNTNDLATWTGSTNITTLGTITTGTWQATPIAKAYLDSDVAIKSSNETISGTWTFSSVVHGNSFYSANNSNVGLQSEDGSGHIFPYDAYGNMWIKRSSGGIYHDASYHRFRSASGSGSEYVEIKSTGIRLYSGKSISFDSATDTIAGIQNQNLLDKTAVETISGLWTWTETEEYLVHGSAAAVYHNVASYQQTISTVTGQIKITLPTNQSNSSNNAVMYTLEITGYSFASAVQGWKIMVSGYSGYVGNEWNRRRVHVISGEPPFSIIKYGNDGSNDFILLGTTSTVWEYPYIAITKVLVNYNKRPMNKSLWNISLVTTEPTTVQRTETLHFLTSSIYSQLENIGTSTISATQWAYLGNMNQDVNSSSNVVFNNVGISTIGDIYYSGSNMVFEASDSVEIRNTFTLRHRTQTSNRMLMGIAGGTGATDWRMWWAPRDTTDSNWAWSNEFGFNQSTGMWYSETIFNAQKGLEMSSAPSSVGSGSVGIGKDGTTDTLIVRNSNSWGTLGAENTSWFYFNTGTAGFYFYKQAKFQGYVTPSADNTYDHGTSSVRWRTGYFGTKVVSEKFEIGSTGLSLGVSEVGYLTGQDQNVKTSSSPTFAGLTVGGIDIVAEKTKRVNNDKIIFIPPGDLHLSNTSGSYTFSYYLYPRYKITPDINNNDYKYIYMSFRIPDSMNTTANTIKIKIIYGSTGTADTGIKVYAYSAAYVPSGTETTVSYNVMVNSLDPTTYSVGSTAQTIKMTSRTITHSALQSGALVSYVFYFDNLYASIFLYGVIVEFSE